MALADAGLPYSAVKAAVCGYCYGDPTCGALFVLLRYAEAGCRAQHLQRDLLGVVCVLLRVARPTRCVPAGHDGHPGHQRGCTRWSHSLAAAQAACASASMVVPKPLAYSADGTHTCVQPRCGHR